MKKLKLVVGLICALGLATALLTPKIAQAQSKKLWEGWVEELQKATGKAPAAPAKKEAKKEAKKK
jgi:cellobiose-specific phosphotransferase system component IIB